MSKIKRLLSSINLLQSKEFKNVQLRKKMKRILFLLCFLSISAHAVEIKLTCQGNYKETINGTLETNIDGGLEVTIIEQKLDKIYRTIIVKGITTKGVSTIPSEKSLDQRDFSNQNRWLVSDKSINLNEHIPESSTVIEINRNTGSIHISSDSKVMHEGKNNLVQEVAIGICSKVDTSKRKF